MMKRLLAALTAILVAASLAACGSDKAAAKPDKQNGAGKAAASQSGTAGSSAQSDSPSKGNDKTLMDKVNKEPTFSGDAVKFFGLEWEAALTLLGNGSVANPATNQYIANDKNGVELSLTNTPEKLKVYKVYCVKLKGTADVSFNGICVGHSLKETDKLLMESGAIYNGELSWTAPVGKETYKIKCFTDDDKTIASIEVSTSDTSVAEIQKQGEELGSNAFAFTEDLHSFEPIYWE